MSDVMRALLMLLVIGAEWYAMQAYHVPVMAVFWRSVMQAARVTAEQAGWLALRAEKNYYISVEAGL